MSWSRKCPSFRLREDSPERHRDEDQQAFRLPDPKEALNLAQVYRSQQAEGQEEEELVTTVKKGVSTLSALLVKLLQVRQGPPVPDRTPDQMKR